MAQKNLAGTLEGTGRQTLPWDIWVALQVEPGGYTAFDGPN